MSKTTEKIYNQMSAQYKNKIKFPTYYNDLTVDQQLFIDNLLDDTADEKLEKLRVAYKGVMEHINGFVDNLEKTESILFPID
jgi:hypothetical protein